MNGVFCLDITRKDISKTNALFKCKGGGFQRMYFNSNENLKRILLYLDIENKNILSVLGSGDQAFHFYNRGAKSVDLFDNNKLAIYYFYLRLWFIKYENIFYPPLKMNKIIIKNLIKKVEPRNVEELDAFNYWNMYIYFFNDDDTEWLFHPTEPGISNNKINDLEKLKEIITNRTFDIYNVDISKDKVNDKKYDIIFKSNVTDYVNNQDYAFYLDNLDNLLNENGIIVSTNVLFKYPNCYEVETFKSKFIFDEMPKYFDNEKKEYLSPGYVYRRK